MSRYLGAQVPKCTSHQVHKYPSARAPKCAGPRARVPRAQAPRAHVTRAQVPRERVPRAHVTRAQVPRAQASPRVATCGLTSALSAQPGSWFLVPGRCADVPELAGCGEYCGAGVLALLAGGRALTSHWR